LKTPGTPLPQDQQDHTRKTGGRADSADSVGDLWFIARFQVDRGCLFRILCVMPLIPSGGLVGQTRNVKNSVDFGPVAAQIDRKKERMLADAN
jgi:hypothetical protein